MLIFAICNIAMAILLYNDRPVPVDENPPVPIATKASWRLLKLAAIGTEKI